MTQKLFTKSAFKQALQCPASLYYYYDSEQYANQNNEDSFLQALADGGNQAGDLAKVYYDIKPKADLAAVKSYDQSIAQTVELLKQDTVNIAEAAFRWENCFVRADIIEKKGNLINLIEVKAKSWNPAEDSIMQKRSKDKVSSSILEYVYDVAFQKYVIQNALGPQFKVKAFLMLADKSVYADFDGINQLFQLVKVDEHHSKVVRKPGAESLRGYAHILTPIDVDEVADRIIFGQTGEQKELMHCSFQEFVKEMAKEYVGHEKKDSPLGSKCFKCPYYSNEGTPGMADGKKECWKKLANFTEEDFARPLVQDLWGQYIDRDKMIHEGKYFLQDLGKDDFKETDRKKPGLTHIERKLLQIGLATGKEELLSDFSQNIHDGVYLDIPGLKTEMSAWRYPLHMIDFETTAVALPFYMGMRPYEQVAFQFSHHIIETDGSIRHAGQYLNTQKRHFPNFEFVRELKRQLEGDNGTVFRYATHENTILRAIRKQLIASSEQDKEELIGFVDTITRATDAERKAGNSHTGSRDMVDLLDIILRYYYHPSMKGSNSIKAVLPAILNSSKAIQKKYQEPIYGDTIPSQNYKNGNTKAWINFNPDSTVKNPYKLLDSVASYLGVTDDELEQFDATYVQEGEQIANGGAALAAYSKLQFASETETKALAEALLRYCELDTMSMVFIWEYFHEMTAAD